ncbi:MAG: hypothetical protein V1725_04745 [archaeon]
MSDKKTPMHGQIRMPRETCKKIAQLFKSSSPKTVIAGLVDIIESYPMREIYDAVRYDSKTGKPTEYAWQTANDRFRGYIVLDAERTLGTLEGEHVLNKNVLDKLFKHGLENTPLLFDTPGGSYALRYEEHTYTASAHNDRWTQTDYGIHIQKTRVIA